MDNKTENKIEIKFEVNDEMFKEVAENSLRALTPEQLTEICQQAVLEYFRSKGDNAIERLIVDKGNYGWDYNPSPFTKKIIESCDFSGLQEVVDKCIDKLKNNYDIVLKDILADMFVESLANNYAFNNSLKTTIRDQIRDMNNQNH